MPSPLKSPAATAVGLKSSSRSSRGSPSAAAAPKDRHEAAAATPHGEVVDPVGVEIPDRDRGGRLPTGASTPAAKPPVPSPRRTTTLSLGERATARSGRPSPSRSPAASACRPAGNDATVLGTNARCHEDPDLPRLDADGRKVGASVPVEVGCSDRGGPPVHLERCRTGEASAPVPEEHAHRIVSGTRDGHVRETVGVEVAQGHVRRGGADREARKGRAVELGCEDGDRGRGKRTPQDHREHPAGLSLSHAPPSDQFGTDEHWSRLGRFYPAGAAWVKARVRKGLTSGLQAA